MAERLTHYTTNHDTIRNWAEERGAQPACVRGTGNGGGAKRRGAQNLLGMIRLDFPGYSGGDSLEPISWDQWFETFDDNNLVLIYQDRTADGQQSNFNKLISVETAAERLEEESGLDRRGSGRQETARKSSLTRARSRAETGGGRGGPGRSARGGSKASKSSRTASAGGRPGTRSTGSRSRGASRGSSGGRSRSTSKR